MQRPTIKKPARGRFFCVTIVVIGLFVDKAAQMIRAAGVAQFAQCLGFDLSNTLAGDIELFADFFQSVVGVHIDTEAHSQYLGFTSRQAGQNGAGCFGQAVVGGCVHR